MRAGERFLQLHEKDQVGVAMADLDAGTQTGAVRIVSAVPRGHKFALRRPRHGLRPGQAGRWHGV